MKALQRKYEALITILREAHFEKEHAAVSEQWHQDAMRRIRGLGPLKARTNFIMFFEQFFWRLTPATCFLILIFTALLFKVDFFPEYDVLTSLIYDTEEVTLVQLFEF
jgi:hypothetical protein